MTRTLATIFTAIILSCRVHSAYAGDDFKMSQIYPIEVGHSYVGFSVKYMGFAKVRGRFTDYSGTVRYDRADITKTSATRWPDDVSMPSNKGGTRKIAGTGFNRTAGRSTIQMKSCMNNNTNNK